MTTLFRLFILAFFFAALTACDDPTTDQSLSDGVAPSDNQLGDEPDGTPNDPPGDQSAGGTEPEPSPQPQPEPQPEHQPQPEPEEEPAAGRESSPGMTYVLPEGWSVGPKKSMRIVTLVPPEPFENAELSVFRFPGDVGGFGANVTRWAGQVGIQFVKAPARTDYKAIEVDGIKSAWIPLVGSERAILAVWVPVGEDPDKPTHTWTLKMSCAATDVEKLGPVVKAWAESIRFED